MPQRLLVILDVAVAIFSESLDGGWIDAFEEKNLDLVFVERIRAQNMTGRLKPHYQTALGEIGRQRHS